MLLLPWNLRAFTANSNRRGLSAVVRTEIGQIDGFPLFLGPMVTAVAAVHRGILPFRRIHVPGVEAGEADIVSGPCVWR